MLKCRGCQLQFAETYPDLDTAETEIYGDRYFVEAIEQRRERLTTFNELMTEIESMVGRKGRLLDVGCGDGVLLEVAADNGWEAEGTDVATAVVRHTRDTKGLAVHQGEVEDIALERGSFDVIVLNHVLEHVRDPRATLSRLRDLLADDGVIRVEVPNVASLSAITQNIQSRYNLKKNRWRHYETGHHFWFFTPRTLARTLNGAGLTPFQISAPAEQWGRVSRYKRTLNVLYRLTFWGGHLIAYARPGNKP
ncbi:MAG: class I SAM-dependent methyltransferase [Candidatus Latescibacterota bacterium]|nr:MAG: class I SAM-dependent methyltransferase [Candidatus Latescibacterota bacterium]